MYYFWQFITQNNNNLDTLIKILGFLLGSGSIFGIISWLIKREWIKRQRTDISVFEIILEPQSLLPILYGTRKDNSPLADHNIIYHMRNESNDTQADLRRVLKKRRYLLITAPAGYGKTREASVLAQSLMAEGYRIVRILPGWLDEPKELPKGLSNNRFRIILFLDDLNGLFRSGTYIQSPYDEKVPFATRPNYHDRLLKVINSFENLCGAKDILVIATARNDPREWSILKFSLTDELWKRFGDPYELSLPTQKSITSFMKTCTENAGLTVSAETLEAIALKNQGAYRNIIQNFQRFRAEEVRFISKDAFIPTLNGTWQEDYDILLDEFPQIQYIYDAIEILKNTNVILYVDIVEELSVLLWAGDNIQRLFRQQRVRQGLIFLTDKAKAIPISNKVLLPYDGQIEDRGTNIRWDLFVVGLTSIVPKYADKYGSSLLESLISLAKILHKLGEFKREELVLSKISKMPSYQHSISEN